MIPSYIIVQLHFASSFAGGGGGSSFGPSFLWTVSPVAGNESQSFVSPSSASPLCVVFSVSGRLRLTLRALTIRLTGGSVDLLGFAVGLFVAVIMVRGSSVNSCFEFSFSIAMVAAL